MLAMLNVNYARSISAVQTADTAPVSQKYGYRVANVGQVQQAQAFVQMMVADCEQLFDKHLQTLSAINENVWRSTEKPDAYGAGYPHCASINLFTDAEFEQRYKAHFGDISPAPDQQTLRNTVFSELAALVKDNGFEFVAACRQRLAYNEQSAEYRLFVRDPVYVADRVAEANARIRDSGFIRRHLIKWGWAKPTPLPEPKLKALVHAANAALPSPSSLADASTSGAAAALDIQIKSPVTIAPQ